MLYYSAILYYTILYYILYYALVTQLLMHTCPIGCTYGSWAACRYKQINATSSKYIHLHKNAHKYSQMQIYILQYI